MIINGSLSYSPSGRKRKTHRRVKKVAPVWKPLPVKDVVRRDEPVYRSAPLTPHSDTPDTSYKREVSKNYTVSIAYNKGAYQVIPVESIKDIGK